MKTGRIKTGIFGLLIIFIAALFGLKIVNNYRNNPQEQNPISIQSSKEDTTQVKGVETTGSVYFGLWTQGFWNPDNNTLHPEALTSLENKIGKHAAIAHYYRGWEALDSKDLLTELTTIYSNGWRPMISANPYFFSKCPSNGLPLYKAIARGNCDEFLKNIGN